MSIYKYTQKLFVFWFSKEKPITDILYIKYVNKQIMTMNISAVT